MKIKLLLISIFVLLFQYFHLNCLAQTPPDIQKIITRGKLVVAICKQDYPPFFFRNNKHELEGFDIEVSKKIANYLNVKLEFNTNANSFEDILQEVINEKADLAVSALSSSPHRALKVAFSNPYLKLNKVLIINRVLDLKLDAAPSSLHEKQLKFAVIKNSSYETFLKENFYTISKYASLYQIVVYNTSEEAMKDLMKGKIYALFTDEIKANYMLENIQSANIYSHKQILEGQTDPISIAINWKNSNLLNWVNLLVEDFEDNGTKEKLIQKYFKGLK
jgi:polar amino acid transport system substrate-binding protein